jgi:hypothetical protein
MKKDEHHLSQKVRHIWSASHQVKLAQNLDIINKYYIQQQELWHASKCILQFTQRESE